MILDEERQRLESLLDIAIVVQMHSDVRIEDFQHFGEEIVLVDLLHRIYHLRQNRILLVFQESLLEESAENLSGHAR